MSKMCELN